MRNYLVLGGFAPLRSNLAVEVYNSHNDRAAVTIREYCLTGGHPSGNTAVAEHVRAVGELAYSRECWRAAIRLIRKHPLAVDGLPRSIAPSRMGY